MASVLAGNSDGRIRVTRTFAASNTVRYVPTEKKESGAGNTAVFQAPMEKYEDEVRLGVMGP